MNRMQHARLFREYLDACDVPGMRRLWAHVAPHLPQPRNDFETMVMIHRARTEARSVPFAMRAYSHQWLLANGMPSGLPNDLKPKAEQIEFTFAYGVGLAVKTASEDPAKQYVTMELHAAMSAAAAEAISDGRVETPFIRQRMAEARTKRLNYLGRPQIRVTVSYDLPGIAAAIKHVR